MEGGLCTKILKLKQVRVREKVKQPQKYVHVTASWETRKAESTPLALCDSDERVGKKK